MMNPNALSLESLVGVPLDRVIAYVAEDKRSLSSLLRTSKWFFKVVLACPYAWRDLSLKLEPWVFRSPPSGTVQQYVRSLRLTVREGLNRKQLIGRMVGQSIRLKHVHTLTVNHGPFPSEKFPLAQLAERFPKVVSFTWEGNLQAFQFKVIGQSWPNLESFAMVLRRKGRGIRRVLRAPSLLTHFSRLKILRIPEGKINGPQLRAFLTMEGTQGRLEELCIDTGKGAAKVLMERLPACTDLKILSVNDSINNLVDRRLEMEFWRQNDILGAIAGLCKLTHLLLDQCVYVLAEDLNRFLVNAACRLETLRLGTLEGLNHDTLENLVTHQPDLCTLSLGSFGWANASGAFRYFARLPKLEYLRILNYDTGFCSHQVLFMGIRQNAGALKKLSSLRCLFVLHDETDRTKISWLKQVLGPRILVYSPFLDPTEAIRGIRSCAAFFSRMKSEESNQYEFQKGRADSDSESDELTDYSLSD